MSKMLLPIERGMPVWISCGTQVWIEYWQIHSSTPSKKQKGCFSATNGTMACELSHHLHTILSSQCAKCVIHLMESWNQSWFLENVSKCPQKTFVHVDIMSYEECKGGSVKHWLSPPFQCWIHFTKNELTSELHNWFHFVMAWHPDGVVIVTISQVSQHFLDR